MRPYTNVIAATGLFLLLFSVVSSVAYAQNDLSNILTGVSSNTASYTPTTPIQGQVDLLIDADSYVPPFYKGRALPSAGTNLRLQAIARLTRADGSLVPSSSIIYTWRQDDRTVGNVSGLGKSSVILPAATLYGTSDIEVTAMSSDGAESATASIAIPSIDPSVVLYEDNPLFGITYYHALGADTSLVDTEMTFAAVPYFAQVQSPNDARLTYAWTVNGTSVNPSTTDPSELTLNATNSSGSAAIGLGITHRTNIFMDANGSWNVTLAAGSSAFTSGASANTVKDPFSGQ